MRNSFEDLRNIIDGLKEDFEEFYEKDNKAAGTRIKKGMQSLKNTAQEIKMEVQEQMR